MRVITIGLALFGYLLESQSVQLLDFVSVLFHPFFIPSTLFAAICHYVIMREKRLLTKGNKALHVHEQYTQIAS